MLNVTETKDEEDVRNLTQKLLTVLTEEFSSQGFSNITVDTPDLDQIIIACMESLKNKTDEKSKITFRMASAIYSSIFHKVAEIRGYYFGPEHSPY